MSNEENDSNPEEEEDYYPNEEDPNKAVRIKNKIKKYYLLIK